MKSSFGKLKKFAFQKNEVKDKKEFHKPPINDLALASQEMEDMRNCYDSLLSAAAAAANTSYEFSESLREMGGCLLEKAELYKDDESKKVLMMLGKVQLELQKLVDRYRSHIFVTITNPSESLLSELQTVQEMKQQCDEKRSVYEYMVAQQKEKGRAKSGKGESFSVEQLQQAQKDYEEEATLCVFRLKSLKEGQTRSLLTQAARHHTAQLNFFKKGLKSLEVVDPHVKVVTEKHHIDYQLGGLDDGYDGEDEPENSYGSYSNDERELSFNVRHRKGTEVVATSRSSMELDQEDQSFPKASVMESTELSFEKVQGDSQVVDSEPRASNYSYSAPLLAEKKLDPTEKIKQMRPSLTQKFHTYVLPTPGDAKSSSSARARSNPRSRPTSFAGQPPNIWHLSPLETNKVQKREPKEDSQLVSCSKTDSSNGDRDSDQLSGQLPVSLTNDTVDAYDHKKIKRQAFSGPLISNPRSTKPGLYASGPITASELPPPVPAQPSSPKASTRRSPPSISPPKISELHELPRPPRVGPNKPTSLGSSGLSAPVKNKSISVPSNVASPLPVPPLAVPRSFSTPSSHYRAKALSETNLVESPRHQEKDVASPPLTPVSLAKANAVLTSSKAGSQSSGA